MGNVNSWARARLEGERSTGSTVGSQSQQQTSVQKSKRSRFMGSMGQESRALNVNQSVSARQKSELHPYGSKRTQATLSLSQITQTRGEAGRIVENSTPNWKQPRKSWRVDDDAARPMVKPFKSPRGVVGERARTELEAHSNPTKLLMAFDIGTTCSGISYCIHVPGQTPEVLAVTRFPAQEQAPNGTKVPSLLYYDESGSVRAAGFEVLNEDIINDALSESWIKAEWWKLHFRPDHLATFINLDNDLPSLPPRKSPVDILTDFIKYLFDCARTYIQGRHPEFTWESVEHVIEYIFTYPNGWEEEQQQLYCRAIEDAGLIPNTPEGRSRVHMLTEGEASFHFCIQPPFNLKAANKASPGGVVIVDAGGGTIDLSMFSMSFSPISCKEVALAECRLQGSVFVTRRAMALLQRKLEGWEHYDEVDFSEVAHEFDQSTKPRISNDQAPAHIKVAGRQYDDSNYNISLGKLKLSSEEATGLFKDSVNAIIEAFEQQQKSAAIHITTAFIVGGFSSNDWLLSRLQLYFKTKGISILYPDEHVNKAAAHGAVLCHLDRGNPLVASQAWGSVYDVIKRATQAERVTEVEIEKTFRFLREQEGSNNKISKLYAELAESASKIQSLHAVIHVHEQKHECEALYASGRIIDAAQSLIGIRKTASITVRTNKLLSDWFAGRCVLELEKTGDEHAKAERSRHAIMAYSTALSLPSASINILTKWASMIDDSVDEILAAANDFHHPRFDICRAVCKVLEEKGRVTEAIECFRKIESEPDVDITFHAASERSQWGFDFQRRCRDRLDELGATAMSSENYSEAVVHFSAILLLDPVDRADILIKRSKARKSMRSWSEALSDADEVIKLIPLSHEGHEVRHAALTGLGRNAEAVEAFKMVLSTQPSPDVDVHKPRRYIDVEPAIQHIVEEIIRPMPQVLIDTETGLLCNKQCQAEAFKALPIYDELMASMTAKLDDKRIRKAVKKFYRYVMFSHKWQDDEPLLEQVENTSVYHLAPSSTHIKLQQFCLLVRHRGFQWAWSDTCCIDKRDKEVQHKSLVAMFSWYRGSSVTIVYLHDIPSEPQLPGGLRGSIWNTRIWTYQEYVAAECVLFYTQDWKPYLGLPSNHKKSLDIISEMQEETGVSAREVAALQPGLDKAREKLYLASTRKTTIVEDAAYALFGIFGVTIPTIYGEGDRAVSRLLEQIVRGSGDVTILAWTGCSGDYNSCLPKDLTVYNTITPPHIPQPIEKAEMDNIIRSSSFSSHSLRKLHKQLKNNSTPSLDVGLLKLPGIISSVTELVLASEPSSETSDSWRIYRATTSMFLDVEIKTAKSLTVGTELCLVHPWIRPLLRQENVGPGVTTDVKTIENETLRLVARLRQRFGVLLFERRPQAAYYRRVAADNLIMTQIHKDVSLDELIKGICTIEIQ